jgi:EAL domain-containing protein (putative c-di-GMP-specific phosphodiesterase class I)
LEVTLDRALRTLWMAYQPIVDAKTRELFAYEALLRCAEPAMPHPGAVLEAAEAWQLNESAAPFVRGLWTDVHGSPGTLLL